ncbi:MAG: hypothetical protein MJ252_14415 [archaeon]|nr:hypothetical protein [archaeon]
MFDLHLKHDIVPLDEGSGFLRNAIKETMKKNLLKPEFCERRLVEIREYSLRLDKYRDETIKKIDECFGQVLSSLKKRKTEFLSEVVEKFKEEKEKIIEDEKKWLDLQEMGQKVLEISRSPNDAEILQNAKYVMDTLRLLDNGTEVKNTKLYNAIENSLTLDNSTVLSYEQLLHYLRKYFSLEEPNLLEFSS